MPTPKHLFELDIDGTWTDITSDIEQFTLARGKDKHSENVPAGSLALTMRNADDKYTPSNASSVLYPYHRPGIGVRGFMVYPYDALDDDGTGALDGRAVGTDGNFGNWSDEALGDFEFDGSNKVKSSATPNSNALCVADFGESDVWVGVDTLYHTTVSYTYVGSLICRYVDSNNYIAITLGPSAASVYILQYVGGTPSSTAVTLASMGLSYSDGDYVRLIAHVTGNELDVYLDNHFVATVTVNPALLTATEFGIGSRNLDSLSRWYNFGGWKPVFEGRTVRVDPRPSTRKKTCFILCNDDKERQQYHRVFTNSDPPESAGDLVGRVLDATDVLSTKRRIDDGDDISTDSTQERPFGLSGLDELNQIEQDSVGLVWIDGAGCYHFEDWDHRLNAPHDEAIATWLVTRSTPEAQTDKYISEPFEWNDGIQLVENEILYQYIRFGTVTGNQQIWRLPEADTSSSFSGRPQFEDDPDYPTYTKPLEFLAAAEQRAADIVPPTPNTDILIYSEEDGTGVNLLTAIDSDQGTVTLNTTTWELDDTGQDFTAAATALDGITHTTGFMAIYLTFVTGDTAWAWGKGDNPDGDGTKVTLQTRPPGHPDAVDGLAARQGTISSTVSSYSVHAYGCYFKEGIDGSFIQLGVIGPDYYVDGTSSTASGAWITDAKLRADIASQGTPAMVRSEDSASQSRNGRRRVQITTKHIDRYSVAKQRAEARKAQRSTERERLTVNLIAGSKANLQESLYRDISDRIHITYSDMGIDGDYYIDRVIHKVDLHSGGAAMTTEFDLTRTSLNEGWGYVKWGEFVWS